MTQDFLRCAKSDFRRNTVCIARKSDKAQHKKDKSGSVSEVSEEVYIYTINNEAFNGGNIMKVKCIANTGTGFSEYTMSHMGCSRDTRLPLCINEKYIVYGQMIYRGILNYLVKGSNENLPSWYPAEIFEVVDPLLPFEWYFQYKKDNDVSAIWGFDELVNDEQYLYDLIERNDKAIRIFLDRKKEIDEYFK